MTSPNQCLQTFVAFKTFVDTVYDFTSAIPFIFLRTLET